MTSCVRGVWAAALTPLHADLSINLDQLIAHTHRLYEQGCDGVAILGTTGEANSFSMHERLSLIERAGAEAFSADRIMVGVGCCAQAETIELSRASIEAGFPNLLMLPPFFYKGVSEEGLFRSYADIIEKLNDDRARIIVYDIPPMTGLEMSVDLLERLRNAFPNIIAGVKDSSGKWEDMEEACERLPNFSVFAGTEKYLLPILRAGGAGCISATANVTSRILENLLEHWRAPLADSLQDYATKLRMTLQAYPPAPALKELMARSTGDIDWRNVRPPIMPLAETKRQSLVDDLQMLNFDITTMSATVPMRSAS